MSGTLPARQRLRNHLFLSFFIVVMVPLTVLSLFHAYSYSKAYQQQVSGRLREAAVGIGDGVDDYIRHHLRALVFMTSQMQRDPDLSPANIEKWLRQGGAAYPGLFTLIAADERGVVFAQKPLDPEIDRQFGTSPPPLGRSVVDRDYFRKVMETRAPYVSEAFRGRGFGAAPIVAVAAPIIRPDGRVIVIEGSLDLERFRTLDQRYDSIPESPVIIADPHGRVVYATAGFGLEPLSETASTALAKGAHASDTYAVLAGPQNEEFMVGHAISRENGWHIYVGQPTRLAFQDVRRNYILTGLLGVAGVLVSLILATWIAGTVTVPMERLVESCENFMRSGARTHIQVSRVTPAEVATLIHTFEQMSDRLGKVLSGLLPICAGCKKIRDDQGRWNVLESYLTAKTDAKLTHGLCPTCAAEYLPLEPEEDHKM